MAGPTVRGDIKVSRNVLANRIRKRIESVVSISGTTGIQLTVANAATIIVTALTVPANTFVRMPVVSPDSAATSGNSIGLPLGPAAGVGTEFLIVNQSGASINIRDNGGTGTSTNNNYSINNTEAAILVCSAVASADDVCGSWDIVRVNQATGSIDTQDITFNNTTDWTAVGTTEHNMTITATTHGKGTDPTYEVYLVTTVAMVRTRTRVEVQSTLNDAGDITLTVNAMPDGRFTGVIEVF